MCRDFVELPTLIEQVYVVWKLKNDDAMRHVCMNVSVCLTREGSAL